MRMLLLFPSNRSGIETKPYTGLKLSVFVFPSNRSGIETIDQINPDFWEARSHQTEVELKPKRLSCNTSKTDCSHQTEVELKLLISC